MPRDHDTWLLDTEEQREPAATVEDPTRLGVLMGERVAEVESPKGVREMPGVCETVSPSDLLLMGEPDSTAPEG